jgi:hydroxymethylbilane synthase
MSRTIRIATRASRLALAQADIVACLLKRLYPDIEISLVKVTTKGDRDRTDFLYKSESVGFFTREVEKAVLDGRADIAVHSLKDLPTAGIAGLIIAAVPQRACAADALVCSNKVSSIAELPHGASVGTSSLRRIAQIRHIRSDLRCVPLRGNVETRISKVSNGQIDAAIVACAALERLGLTEKISAVLSLNEFIPAPAQGALAVQTIENDTELTALVSKIDDTASRITAETERHLLAVIHGGCSIPLGAYSYIEGNNITIDAMLADVEGKKYIRLAKTSVVENARTSAEQLAEELLSAGGREILAKIRNSRI